jgi:hypothetical protein
MVFVVHTFSKLPASNASFSTVPSRNPHGYWKQRPRIARSPVSPAERIVNRVCFRNELGFDRTGDDESAFFRVRQGQNELPV